MSDRSLDNPGAGGLSSEADLPPDDVLCPIDGCPLLIVKYGRCQEHQEATREGCAVPRCSWHAWRDGRCQQHQEAA